MRSLFLLLLPFTLVQFLPHCSMSQTNDKQIDASFFAQKLELLFIYTYNLSKKRFLTINTQIICRHFEMTTLLNLFFRCRRGIPGNNPTSDYNFVEYYEGLNKHFLQQAVLFISRHFNANNSDHVSKSHLIIQLIKWYTQMHDLMIDFINLCKYYKESKNGKQKKLARKLAHVFIKVIEAEAAVSRNFTS